MSENLMVFPDRRAVFSWGTRLLITLSWKVPPGFLLQAYFCGDCPEDSEPEQVQGHDLSNSHTRSFFFTDQETHQEVHP